MKKYIPLDEIKGMVTHNRARYKRAFIFSAIAYTMILLTNGYDMLLNSLHRDPPHFMGFVMLSLGAVAFALVLASVILLVKGLRSSKRLRHTVYSNIAQKYPEMERHMVLRNPDFMYRDDNRVLVQHQDEFNKTGSLVVFDVDGEPHLLGALKKEANNPSNVTV